MVEAPMGRAARSAVSEAPPGTRRRSRAARTTASQPASRTRSRGAKMSAPRSATETKTGPSGGRPIVSTVSAQTADARVWGVTPLGGRAQIVWWARPSVAPEGRTARQLWAKSGPRVGQEPGAAVVADPAGPLERAMRREIEDRVVVDHEDDRMPRRRGATLGDMRVHDGRAGDRPTVEQPVPRFGVGKRAELSRQALVRGPGDRRHDAHEPVGASCIAKIGRPELGLGPTTGFIEHVCSLARPSEAAKSARDMRPLAHKR